MAGASIRSRTAAALALGFAVVAATAGFVPSASALEAAPRGNAAQFSPTRILVGYERSTAAVQDSIEGAVGATDLRAVGPRSHVLRVDAGTVLATIAELRRYPQVRYAEPDYLVHAVADEPPTPDDTYFNLLWGLRNTGQSVNGTVGTADADIDADLAWGQTTGSTEVVVGVVDTGIDYTHPDLDDNMWTAPSGGLAGCPEGTHGFNAITGSCDPRDDNDHGTHVAGTIGAEGNNATGVTGINWSARLMALKFLNSRGSGYTSDAIEAIDFANQAKDAGVNIRVLNNSWGGGAFSQALLDAIKRANDRGILFVAAAGNDGASNEGGARYPCTYDAPNVLCVAATDQDDRLASFSNYGATSVDVAAPGTKIASTVRGGGYASFSGTSMATPHVSGAASLVLAAYISGGLPVPTVAELKASILDSVDELASLDGLVASGGRLNVCNAVPGCAGPPPPPPPPPTAPEAPALSAVAGSGTVDLSWTAPDDGGSAITGYRIYRGTSSGGEALLATVGAVASYQDASAANGTTYYYEVSAVNAVGEGPRSAEVFATPQTADFSLSASPTTRTVRPAHRTSYTVTITRLNGFTGSVGLSVSGLPYGATASFSPNPATMSSTLTVSTRNNTPEGTYVLTVRGVAGGLTRDTTVTLVVRRG